MSSALRDKIRIKIDLYEKPYVIVPLVQHNDTILHMPVYEKDMPYNLDRMTVTLAAELPDSTDVLMQKDIEISGDHFNIVSVPLASEVTAMSGDVKFELIIAKNGQTVTSYAFLGHVTESMLSGDDPIVKEDVSGNIYEAIKKANVVSEGLEEQTEAARDVTDHMSELYEEITGSLIEMRQLEADAEASAEEAKTAETGAVAAKNIALSAQTGASGSAEAARIKAELAEAERIKAETAAGKAKVSEDNAKLSENAAKESETKSKASETNSKASESASKTSETNAKNSETESKKSQTASKTSETNSKTSETNSKQSETAAKESETKSKASETAAKTSETNAGTSETEAKKAQTATELSANEAKTIVDSRAEGIYLESSTAHEISLSGTESGKVKELHIYGASSQAITTGKNLFDISKVTGIMKADGTLLSPDRGSIKDGILTVNHAQYSSSAFIAGFQVMLSPGTYTISTDVMHDRYEDNMPNIGMGFFDISKKEYKNVTVALNLYKEWSRISSTITIVEDMTVALRLQGHGSASNMANLNDKFKNIQLELGSVATAYEPYSGGYLSPSPDWSQPIITDDAYNLTVTNGTDTQTAHVDVPLQGIQDGLGGWDARDEITINNGRVIHTRKTGSIVYKGTEGINITSTYTNTIRFTCSPGNSYAGVQRTLCSHLPTTKGGTADYEHSNNGGGNGAIGYWILKTRIGVIATDTPAESVSKFKAWLAAQYASGTPVTSIYRLATPIVTDITNTPLGQSLLSLHSYDGTTTITTDSIPAVDVSATVKYNVKSYVDNEIIKIKQMLLNIN